MITKRLKINITILSVFALIGAITLIITNRFVQQLSTEERQKIDLWVMGIRQLATVNYEVQDYDYTFILEVLHNNKTIPVILVDNSGKVTNYMNISASRMANPHKVRRIIARMSRSHQPIVFTLYDDVTNTVYYDDSITLKRLSLYPYILLVVILVFVLTAYFIISQSWRAEQNDVWIGLAKETAHQLGTPTSSLMACLELLRQQDIEPKITEELGKDIDRLERITRRFSKIGSNPDLQEINLIALVDSSISYLSSRLSAHVHICANYNSAGKIWVLGNSTLLEWVFENIVKNGVDAMQGSGQITINIIDNTQLVFVDISDQGKGIARSNFRTVFNPGYTTKKRGWGLGLTLTKRIVEEYHRGKIFVLKSEINRGTTFRIVLKK